MHAKIYADFAAATPIDDRVSEVMSQYASDKFYNPSAVYLSAQSVRADIENARDQIAKTISCRSSEIYFTAGATESCNLAIKGIMGLHPDKKLVVSAIEHSAVSKPATHYAHTTIAVDETGVIDLEKLTSHVQDPDVVLVSIMYANNEIGVVQPIRRIVEIIESERSHRTKEGVATPLYLHIDAAQAPNYINIDVNRLGVDLMTLNSSKIYGPKQVGLLFVQTGVVIDPLVEGGGQENGLRSGTENVAGIIGFATALAQAVAHKNAEFERLDSLRSKFIDTLECEKHAIVLNSKAKKYLPNIVNVSMRGLDGERVVMELDERGIMCATGAACSANSGAGSPTLKAIGLPQEAVDGSVRFSFGRTTDEQEVLYIAQQLVEVIEKLRKLQS